QLRQEAIADGTPTSDLAATSTRNGHQLTNHPLRLIEPGQEIILSQGASVGRPSTLYAVAEAHSGEIASIEVGGGVCLIGGGELALPSLDITANSK
ncbi:hypothetical protein ACF07K_37145, partial [Streptomyces sp. NPDC015350]